MFSNKVIVLCFKRLFNLIFIIKSSTILITNFLIN
jgi:hypothetical protein